MTAPTPFQSPHIAVALIDGHVVVSTVDYELYDFLEDVFTDANVDPAFCGHDRDGPTTSYCLHFPASFTRQTIDAILHSLDAEEIERIANLNR